MADGSSSSPDEFNDAYWNHVRRTGEQSRHWELRRADQLLGTFVSAPGYGADMFWHGYHFLPEPPFEELRPLFDEELRLLNADWTDNDLSDQYNATWEEIERLGLRLVEEHGWSLSWFMLHVDGDRAWFRI